MPQLQFLGTMPEKRSPIADILKAGVGPGIKAFEKAEERRVDLAKIGYNKKKGAADLIIRAAENATPQQREKLFEEGGTTADLIGDVYGEESLNALRGTAGKGAEKAVTELEQLKTATAKKGGLLEVSPDLPPAKQLEFARGMIARREQQRLAKEEKKKLEPTVAASQKMGAIKSGINRGHVVIGKQWGEPEEFDIKSQADVFRAIELGGFDPSDPFWQDTIGDYETVIMRSPEGEMGKVLMKNVERMKTRGYEEVM